jgi:hypothetical protein
MFFLPVAEILPVNEPPVILKITGFYEAGSGQKILFTVPVVILNGVILFFYVLSIFLYKRRMIQLRLCILNIILLIGLMCLFAYHLFFYVRTLDQVDFKIGLSFILPVIAIILTYFAFHGIRKDEYLVRLADRIR